MAQRIDDLFDGFVIPLHLPRRNPTSFEGKSTREAAANPTQGLRYTCHVAEALNSSLNGGRRGSSIEEYGYFEINGEQYYLNPKARSQFGKDAKNQPYLTTSLVHVETGTRYSFTWRGDNVPYVLKEQAVLHDEGKPTPAKRISLPLKHAEKHIIGEKRPGQKKRAEQDAVRKRNHDPNAASRAYRRTHGRVCRDDL